MPVVRRAERTVTIGALRGGMKQAAATPLSEGAGVAQARGEKFGALGGTAERVARIGVDLYGRMVEQEHEAADSTALLRASNALAEWKAKRLYDPEKGALTLKGEAALPLPEEVRSEFTEVAGGIEATLSSPRQRAAFEQMRSQEWQSVDLQVRRHVAGEIQAYRAQELRSHVENSVNAAIASATDPKLVQVELMKATSAIRKNAPTLGVGPEQVEEQVRQVTSTTHLGVISQLLAQDNDRGAEAYFAATKDQIAGDKLDEVQRALEEGTLRGAGQRSADAIIGAGGTAKEQLEKARAIEDPKLRDQVEDRVTRQIAIDERARKDHVDALERNAYDILDRTGDVTKIPPAQWTAFDGPVRAGMRAYAKAKTKGDPIETDLPTYYALMGQAGSDAGGFAKVDLLRYRAKLGEAEFKQLAGLQLSIKSSDTRQAEKDLAPFQSRQQLVDDTLTLHGINPEAKADSPEGKAIAQLRRMVDLRVNTLQADGRKASNQDIQGEIDGILSATSTTPGTWWAILRPFTYDISDKSKRLVDTTVNDISAADRANIESALKARNRPVSDATVLDLYIETRLRQSRQGTK